MAINNNKALYLVIADKIMDDILSGKLRFEDRLPSIRDYAAQVQVNHNTIVRTYDYLANREVIFNRRGLGFFVAREAAAIVDRLRRNEVLGEELEGIFHRLRLLDISPEELRSHYADYLKKIKDEEKI